MTIFLAFGMLLYWVADATLSGALAEIKPRVDPAYERFDHARALGPNNEGGEDVVAIGYREITTASRDAFPVSRIVATADAANEPVTITYADLFFIQFDVNNAAHTSRLQPLTRARSFSCIAALRHSNVDYVAWRETDGELGIGRIDPAEGLVTLWTQKSAEADAGTCPELMAGKRGEAAAVFNFLPEEEQDVYEVLFVGLRGGEVAESFDLAEAFGPLEHRGVRSTYSAERNAFYALWQISGRYYVGTVTAGFEDTSSQIFQSFGPLRALPDDALHLTTIDAEGHEPENARRITLRQDGSLLLRSRNTEVE